MPILLQDAHRTPVPAPPLGAGPWRFLATVVLATGLLTLGCSSTVEPPDLPGDPTPPTVVQTTPVPGAAEVDTAATIVVVFSEAMNPSTVRPGSTFQVSTQSIAIAGTVVGDTSQRRFVFVPEHALPGERQVDVLVRDVADASGTWLADPFMFSFQTGGESPLPPRVPTNPYPADGANAVPIDTTFTWSGGSEGGEQVVYDFWLGTDVANLNEIATDLTVPEYAPGTLSHATAYVWKVVARSAGGSTEGPPWRFTTVPFTPENSPPDTPCSPYPAHSAQSVPDTTRLQWGCATDPDEDALSFEVHLGTTTNPPLVATVDSPLYVPSTPLALETVYYWRIVADDGRGGRTQGPLWSFTTRSPENRPPNAPCNQYPPQVATGVADTTRLVWGCGTDPDGDTVRFEVHLGTTQNPPLVATVSAPPYAPPAPLARDTRYYWKIIADDGRGGRTAGPLWWFTTEPPENQPPSAPAPPIYPEDGATIDSLAATLTWSGGVDPEQDPVTFSVRFGTQTPPPFRAEVSSRSLRVADLEWETTYYWQVEAADDHGHSVPGPIWQFRTPDQPNTPPSSPTSPDPPHSAKEIIPGIALTWSGGDDVDGDAVEFVIFLERDDATDPDSVATVSERSYLPVLEEAADYFWRIEARDARGAATSGPIWQFTTNYPPEAPCNPTPDDGETGVGTIVRLRWGCGRDPEEGPMTYDVYFGTAPDPGGPIATSENRSYFLGGVLPETTYYWRIVARDRNGAEASGPVWSFTTEN